MFANQVRTVSNVRELLGLRNVREGCDEYIYTKAFIDKAISNNKKRDKNGIAGLSMKNMAESKPRPIPKPRPRQKSLPASTANNISDLSSSPSSKPPITQPKPKGYKTLDFKNTGLVSICADIDIEDGPVASKNTPTDEEIEKNNNTSNLKNALGKSPPGVKKPGFDEGNSQAIKKSFEKVQNVSVLSKAPAKPLPPLPSESPEVPAEKDQNVTGILSKEPSGKVNSGLSNRSTSPLPSKLPRMCKSVSELQLGISSSDRRNSLDNSALSPANSNGIQNSRLSIGRNPPLPRKPTMLRRSPATRKQDELSTAGLRNFVDERVSPSEEADDQRNDNANIERPPPLPKKLGRKHLSSSEMQQESVSAEVGNSLDRSGFSSSESSDKNSDKSNIGSTSQLPRKPARKLSPASGMHCHSSKAEEGSEEQKRRNSLEQNLSQSGTISGRLAHGSAGNRDGKWSGSTSSRSSTSSTSSTSSNNSSNSSSSSVPAQQLRRNSPKCSAVKNATPATAEEDVGNLSGRPGLPRKPATNNACSDEASKQGHTDFKLGRSRSSPPVARSPHRPPPELPHQTAPPLSPTRRPPPELPKQPSLKSNRKTTPPPLPKAPRPKSVAGNSLTGKTNFPRSQSMEDLFHEVNGEDDEYWVAYQHLGQIGSPLEKTSQSSESAYEAPDENVLKGFMEAIKSKNDRSKEKRDEINQDYEEMNSRKRSTYSSSSDDSSHDYVEPETSTSEKKENGPESESISRSSSDELHHYVEAIHDDAVVEPRKTSESSNKKFEFKPFDNVNGEWSQPKEITWEYEGESDDSDVSYDEPFEDEDCDSGVGDEEPLYQIYQANVLQKERTLSLKRRKKSSYSEPSPILSGNSTLKSGTLRGGKMLWCQLPEVRNSGILENVKPEQRKLQEAIYEVVSSEASYLKSLNLLVDHFMSSKAFSVDSVDPVLDKKQVSELFSNIKEVIKVSESFLEDLRTRQRQSVYVDSISDIITNHATNHFQAYVTYCSTQYKQGRMLSNLRTNSYRFADALEKLERDSRVYGLSLQSFLVLPMQRVTRYPLLVDAIVRRCEPGRDEYYKTDEALKAVNQVVHKCNEGARNEDRHEEMLQIQKVITFSKIKPIQLVTKDRWLLRRGPVQLMEIDSKMSLSNTLRGKLKKYRFKTIYLFLFNDLLVITKKKSETVYSAIDFANRNMIRVQEARSNVKNSFLLVFLENCDKKTKELHVRTDNETDMTRWRDAFEPPEAERDDEKIYGTWDCPQVQALHNYQAKQSDELSLVPGDVVNVLRKLSDGWYEGERIRDGMCGWFPANHTEEILNEHVRARNLHQRYRLLAASTAFLDKRKR